MLRTSLLCLFMLGETSDVPQEHIKLKVTAEHCFLQRHSQTCFLPLQDEERGTIFDGIRTIAAFYLRADSSAICECIQNFGLNDLLFSVARLEMAFKKTLRSGLTLLLTCMGEYQSRPDGSF